MTDQALTPAADLLRGAQIPASLRRLFRALLDLRSGTLDMVLPDGRVVRFEGAQDGPRAPRDHVLRLPAPHDRRRRRFRRRISGRGKDIWKRNGRATILSRS